MTILYHSPFHLSKNVASNTSGVSLFTKPLPKQAVSKLYSLPVITPLNNDETPNLFTVYAPTPRTLLVFCACSTSRVASVAASDAPHRRPQILAVLTRYPRASGT
uniref:Ovule protein n=1 Tax=Steinernema glaseri TaxID=37863 RepID=A0A1I8AP19_9BILA